MSESDSWSAGARGPRRLAPRFHGLLLGHGRGPGAARSAAAATAAEIQKTQNRPGWLEFQDCAGNTESFLRASRPTAAEIVLDTLSVDYHETIMAAAGHQARKRWPDVKEKAGAYIAASKARSHRRERRLLHDRGRPPSRSPARCAAARPPRSHGTCATSGPARRRRTHGALGVGDAVPGVKNLINLSACPANVETHRAHRLLPHFKRWPELDAWRRPLFAYGKAIHDNCERRPTSTPASTWRRGDERTHGYCSTDGLQGPVTFQNCPNVR